MASLLLLVAFAAVAYFLLVGPQRAGRTPPARWLIAVAAIAGALLYLRSPIDLIPDGVGVLGFLDDLIVILCVAWWLRNRLPVPQPAGQRPPRAKSPRGLSWDPYAVLGVSRGASREEISTAYRQRMKEYHPDRVCGLGEEIQRVAHEKTLEIQRAYEELRGA
jgi:DnaJ domain/Protein of unknown function (DUF1232)